MVHAERDASPHAMNKRHPSCAGKPSETIKKKEKTTTFLPVYKK
jgi:hypothetical protein